MTNKDYIHLIERNILFKDFSSEELHIWFSKNNYPQSRYTSYKKNSIIHLEGEKCSDLDIIITGEVLIQKICENGEMLTITQFNAGSNLAGNLIFSDFPYYPMSVLAKSDTVILHINKDLVLELCQKNKSFLQEFLRCVSQKTAILTNKIKLISTKSIRQSIIDFLNIEFYSQNNYKIKLVLTKKELAERLGIQRTSLSRELNKMKKDGLLLFDADSITICDYNIIKKPEM